MDGPDALVFDSSGNLYVSDSSGYAVSEFAPGRTTPFAKFYGSNGMDGGAMAFDPSGSLYVVSYNSVTKFAPGSLLPVATLTGVSSPDALAFDSSGNLYVANYYYNTVSKFAPGSTTPSATLTGLGYPDALAFDSSGNLFVANWANNTVSKFAPGGTKPIATLTGLNRPKALALDSSGNLYVANSSGATVSEFAPGSTTPTATLTGLSYPDALAFDSNGYLYVVSGVNSVSEFAPGSTTPTATLSGLDVPDALALDSNGNLYVANDYGGTVSEFTHILPTASDVVIRSSLPTLPITLGGNGGAASGVDLTDAELAQIYTASTGTLTIGDSAQTGNITFTSATPVTTPGASIDVLQDPSGPGQIILEDSVGTALNGNGGTVTLTPGTGGIVTPLSATGTPLATQGFNATGLTLAPTLSFAPTAGEQFTIINNTSANPIAGTFANLPQGGTISASYGGTTYNFQANYSGGDGNDLVLTASKTPQTISFGPIGSHLYGDQVPLSATSSSSLPVTFSVISGPASLTGNTLTMTGVGTVTVKATQAGNSAYAAATPVNETIVVNPAPLTITADNQTTAYGAALPTLTVQYAGFVNGDTSASLTTQPTVTTSASISSPVGTYAITASGADDPDYTISYVPGTLTIAQDATTTYLNASPNPSVLGQSVIFTATISPNSPGSGTPTGSVTFEDGTTTLGTETLTGGAASFTTSNLTVASHSITAVYGGDANFVASTSTSLTQVVTQVATQDTVTLTRSGAGNALSLTENTSGATPAIVISEPTASGNLLEIDLGAGNVFAAGSTTAATGLTYQNAGSPTTSQYATIDISTANTISVLQATLPGDDLTLGPVYDSNAGIGGITASAGSIEVAGIDTHFANGNVNLAASGNLTVDAGATLTTGTGTISLAADVNADGTGNATGVGTLAIDAGAVVTSTDPASNAITLRGANVNIDTSSNPAIVGAVRHEMSAMPVATLSGLNHPSAMAVDPSGNLYVTNSDNNGNGIVSEFAPGSTTPTATLAGLDGPGTMAVDSNGNLFVANQGQWQWQGYVGSGNGGYESFVSEFAPGSTTPTATLTGISDPLAMAFDSKGNLFVAAEGPMRGFRSIGTVYAVCTG